MTVPIQLAHHVPIATAKALAAGRITESQVCFVQGIDTRTGAVFRRAFATYGTMEQWLATDLTAQFIDITTGNGIIGPATSY